MTKVEGLQDFFNKVDKLEKAYNKLPNEFAAIAVKFSKERFRKQNWLDKSPVKWEKRVQRRKGGVRRSQTLLVDKGRLKRSIRKIHADRKRIIIGTDVPYAGIHNFGGKIQKKVTVKQHTVSAHTRKAHTRKIKGRKRSVPATNVKSHIVDSHQRMMNLTIPQRQFMGNSHTLSKSIIKHGVNRFDKALK